MLTRGRCLSQRWQFQCDGAVVSSATAEGCTIIGVITCAGSLYILKDTGEQVMRKAGLGFLCVAAAAAVRSAAFAVGGRSAARNLGKLHVYDARGERIFARRMNAPVTAVSLSEDGETLAAVSSEGKAYLFKKGQTEYRLRATYSAIAGNSLRCMRLSADGGRCYIGTMQGVIALEADWQEPRQIWHGGESQSLDVINNESAIIAAVSGGGLSWVDLKTGHGSPINVPARVPPVCSFATTSSGELVFCGSCDRWLCAITANGTLLGRLEIGRQVCSVSTSSDGALICVGLADGSVRLVENTCAVGAYRELVAHEFALNEAFTSIGHLDCIVEAYARYGVFEYGYNQLRQAESLDPKNIQDACARLLQAAAVTLEVCHWAHYELGVTAQSRGRHYEAIQHLQRASINQEIAAEALVRCADSFRAKQLANAVASCYRRASNQHIDADLKETLYELACRYEANQQWEEAISHYQLLASHDICYGDSWERLQRLSMLHKNEPEHEQYRPDCARVDDRNGVGSGAEFAFHGDALEMLPPFVEQERVATIIKSLRHKDKFSRGPIWHGLEYAEEIFARYDFSLPEDETKKVLETVNLLDLLGDAQLRSTLDLGSASGRYPMLFSWLGADATGIDIEASAIQYASQRRMEAIRRPTFIVADARELPFRNGKFDLVTCMMGTFAHIRMADQAAVLANAYRVLRVGGSVAISTWNPECRHLAYLSIYSERQKEMIRVNSRTLAAMVEMLANAGFDEIATRPFCLLPESAVYDLGIEKLRSEDLLLAARADLAVRSRWPSRHGEMYLVYGRRCK